MNLRSATYVTTQEERNGALDDEEGFEDKNNVTTDADNDSEPEFDSPDGDGFDPIVGGDYDVADYFIDVGQVKIGGGCPQERASILQKK